MELPPLVMQQRQTAVQEALAHAEEPEGKEALLLGTEAAALGALHAGLSAAYGYPGTPSTEAMELLVKNHTEEGVRAQWCANEKTAYEAALGISYAGRRALVTMKHVGLNVAADPFVNSALVTIKGGLMVLVADDPGMHSSQNEQDSRILADFAKVPVLEPASVQEAYDMARYAYDLSEKHHVPVLLRLVTRLAHARGRVKTRPPRTENPPEKAADWRQWNLLPLNARRQWRTLLATYQDLAYDACDAPANRLALADTRLGVITTGNALGYYLDEAADLDTAPSHLHIGQYPVPVQRIQELAAHVDRILVLEDGQPYVERMLHGALAPRLDVQGRLSGAVPIDGELDPDTVRDALGLPRRKGIDTDDRPLVPRPPQLCQGCPHRDSFDALNLALEEREVASVTSDIGCYTLGVLPPYNAGETCVCMGSSIGMARGVAEAGLGPTIAILGDSTFLHSGVPALMDAVDAGTSITLLVLDNSTVGMTGQQDPILPGDRIHALARAVGVDDGHIRVLEAHSRQKTANAAVIRKEIDHDGPSVLVLRRECVQALRRWKKEGRE